MGALTKVQELGVIVVFCDDFSIVKVVRKICERAGEPIKVSKALKVEFESPAEKFYAGLPGVGQEIAAQLARVYSRPLDAIVDICELDETLGIVGLGPKKRQTISEFLGYER